MWNRIKQWLGASADGQPEAVQTVRALSQEEQQALSERLERLQNFAEAREQALREQPLVVLDLETTGLDVKRDTVLSVGAVRVGGGGIELGQTFERVLAVQVALKSDAQLFHGFTQADLAAGEDPREVLLELLEWGQDAIWLAWHAWFDEAMLYRSARQWLGLSGAGHRLPKVYDLAHAMPVLFPEHAQLPAQLDAWLQALHLGNSERHHAVADAMATAELALVALARAQAHGFATWGELAAAMERGAQQHALQQQGVRQQMHF